MSDHEQRPERFRYDIHSGSLYEYRPDPVAGAGAYIHVYQVISGTPEKQAIAAYLRSEQH